MALKPSAPGVETPPPEVARMAGVLRWGARLAWGGMAVAHVLYLTGVLPARVPVAQGMAGARLSSDAYAGRFSLATGWGWARELQWADRLNVLPVALLALVMSAALLAVLPGLIRRRERAFAAFALAAILVVALAAAGLCDRGG